MITDSGMLMGEVLQSSRRPDGSAGGRATSLLWALHHRKAALYLPRHIVEEVERDLPRRAKAGDDVDLAYHRLRTLYLPRARIIDVPAGWALNDPRVKALAGRHPTDLPTAQLAVTIGGCFLLSEDPDLCGIPQLGFSAWLKVTHAAANEIEAQAIFGTVSIPLDVLDVAAGAAYRRIAAASFGGEVGRRWRGRNRRGWRNLVGQERQSRETPRACTARAQGAWTDLWATPGGNHGALQPRPGCLCPSRGPPR
jgi:hypothetical protein